MKKVQVSDVASAVHEILEEYFDGIETESNKLVSKVAAKTAKELENDSPKNKGDYSKGWYIKQTKKSKSNNEVIIANKHYQLTHLLEHGHIQNVHGKVLGFTKGQEHIRPAEQNAINEMLNGIEKVAKQ